MTTARSVRIVVTGAESTGKTSLATHLADRFGARLVPERLRAYVDESGRLPTASDMEEVARQHCEAEDQILGEGGDRLYVYDTDLWTIVIYARRYFGECPQWIVDEAELRRPDLYLLLRDDIPWMPDPQRDGPETRRELQQVFETTIPRAGPCVSVAGTGPARAKRAEEAVAEILLATGGPAVSP